MQLPMPTYNAFAALAPAVPSCNAGPIILPSACAENSAVHFKYSSFCYICEKDVHQYTYGSLTSLPDRFHYYRP